jgi:hypothetical protein
LGERGAANTTDFLSILSDPEYMAGVKEKLKMIATFDSNLAPVV